MCFIAIVIVIAIIAVVAVITMLAITVIVAVQGIVLAKNFVEQEYCINICSKYYIDVLRGIKQSAFDY